MTTNRERIEAILNGVIIDYVPGWIHSFFNSQTARRLVPPELWSDSYDRFQADRDNVFTATDPATLDKMIDFNRLLDRPMIGVGRGGMISGHGGPGEFIGFVIEETPTHQVIEFETGAQAKLQFKPYFYHPYQMPVKTLADLEAIELPDPAAPQRWAGLEHDIAYLKERGEYTVGYLNGFFSGCHYYFCDYQEFLSALILEPEFSAAVIEKLAVWNILAAENMFRTGVDSVLLCDDLGSENNLLISPHLYHNYFYPWHQQLCDLAHSRGVKVHLHSHGNINKVLDMVVYAGFDMLNPLDQTEDMDLAAIKARYGDHLTLVGGLDKYIFDLDAAETERRMRRAVETGSPRGRYILTDPSGVPESVTPESFQRYLRISRRVRGQEEPQ